MRTYNEGGGQACAKCFPNAHEHFWSPIWIWAFGLEKTSQRRQAENGCLCLSFWNLEQESKQAVVWGVRFICLPSFKRKKSKPHVSLNTSKHSQNVVSVCTDDLVDRYVYRWPHKCMCRWPFHPRVQCTWPRAQARAGRCPSQMPPSYIIYIENAA